MLCYKFKCLAEQVFPESEILAPMQPAGSIKVMVKF